MKATNRNSRTNKQGFVYNADHNTRRETRERQDHIDNDRIKDNQYWYYDSEQGRMVATRIGFSAREKEIAAYRKLYQAGLDAKNEYYKKQGHQEKCKTIEQVYSNKRTCPLETVLQIGNRDEHVTGEELQRAVIKYLNEFQRRYKGNIQILSVALHMDESVPHVHVRYTFMAHNKKTNLLVPNQTKAFEELHIERADTSRPKDRHNNALTTFSDINRKMFYDTIEQTLGIKINRDVESPSRRHKDKLEWQVEQLKKEVTHSHIEQRAVQEFTAKLRDDLQKQLKALENDISNKKQELSKLNEIELDSAFEAFTRRLINYLQSDKITISDGKQQLKFKDFFMQNWEQYKQNHGLDSHDLDDREH